MKHDTSNTRRNKLSILIALLISSAGALAYSNSFAGSFLFDDDSNIVRDEAIRSLWPPSHLLTHRRRPVVNVSLAANYALGGLHVWGYHLFNLVVHMLAGLTLFGLIRRTCLLKSMRERLGGWGTWSAETVATWMAGAVAVLWTVHPLHTQAVTYVIQRSESMMGLFYLLTLYGVARGSASRRPGWWYAVAVGACFLGMGCKAVMVTAPLMVLLFDRSFLSTSWGSALRRRWGLYAGLAGTWLVLLVTGVIQTVLFPRPQATSQVGFGFTEVTPWEYLISQPGVLLHYLRLVFWPYPLCLDYDWPVAQGWAAIAGPGLVVLGLLGLTLWTLVRGPRWAGFCGAWFFLILSPTSSFIPIKDLAFEHRMYLPLAGVMMIVVAGVMRVVYWGKWARAIRRDSIGGVLSRKDPNVSPWTPAFAGVTSGLVLCVVAVLCVAAALCFATVQRNRVYRSEIAMWSDVAAQRPHNARARVNLGIALVDAGRLEEAMKSYREAVASDPGYALAHFNLGIALARAGRYVEAVEAYRGALAFRPHDVDARYNLGIALASMGRLEEAIAEFQETLAIQPDNFFATFNLGTALVGVGDHEGAARSFGAACELQPNRFEPHFLLGRTLLQLERLDEALASLRRAVELNRLNGEARMVLARALMANGDIDAGVAELRSAIAMNPGDAKARAELSRAMDSSRASTRSDGQ